MQKKTKILFVIGGLGVGGAEMRLYHTLRHMNLQAFEPHVLSLGGHRELGKPIEDLGVSVNELNDTFPIRTRDKNTLVYNYAKELGADVVFSLTSGSFFTEKTRDELRTPVVWSIGNMRPIEAIDKEETRVNLRRCAAISGYSPAAIVCNSRAVYDVYSKRNGFDTRNMQIIDAGVDTEFYKPDQNARQRIRKELHLSDDVPLVGIIARNDSQKDLQTFLRAMILLNKKRPDVHFALVGRDIESDPSIQKLLKEAGFPTKNIHFLGQREDIQNVANAFDVGVSSSIYEATGNTVLEMMSCGVSCVVTDTGIMRDIVGNTGIVVNKEADEDMAAALEKLINKSLREKSELSENARKHVLQHFDIRKMVRAYEELFTSLAHPHASSRIHQQTGKFTIAK